MKFRLAAFLLIFFSTAALATPSTIYNTIDSSKKDSIPPQFPGGMDVFYEYLKTNIKFPIVSRLKGIQGKVVVNFVVDSSGQVSKVKISRGLDKHCNEEALRVIRLCPKWIPGDINGKRADFLYNIPLSFKDTVSIAGARIMVNGSLLKSYKKAKKTDLNKMPFYILPPDLATAIFGAKYNKLVVFNDSTINFKGYSEAHFKNTFNMLQNIDTGKIQLNVSEKASSFSTWRQYLNKDSILGIFIYPAATYRTQDKNKLGTITLITKAGLDRQKKIKNSLLESIISYRNGTSPLRKEMIIIDEYHYNSLAIFNKIDTGIIHTVNILPPAEAINLFGDSYKDGIIYIYTKRYQSNRQKEDKQKLLTLLEQYKREGKAPVRNIIFINNTHIVDFKKLSELPTSDIRYVNIINKEEARAFFGDQEQNGIIYITTSSDFTN